MDPPKASDKVGTNRGRFLLLLMRRGERVGSEAARSGSLPVAAGKGFRGQVLSVAALLVFSVVVGWTNHALYGGKFLGLPGEINTVIFWSQMERDDVLARRYGFKGEKSVPRESDRVFRYYIPGALWWNNLFAHGTDAFTGLIRQQIFHVAVFGLSMYFLVLALTQSRGVALAISMLSGFRRDAFLLWWGMFPLDSLRNSIFDPLFPLFVLLVWRFREKWCAVPLIFAAVGLVGNLNPLAALHLLMILSLFFLCLRRESVLKPAVWLQLAAGGALAFVAILPYYFFHKAYYVPTLDVEGSVFEMDSLSFIAWLARGGNLPFHLKFLLPALSVGLVLGGIAYWRGDRKRAEEMFLLLGVVVFVSFFIEYLTRPLGVHRFFGLHLRTLRAARFLYPVLYLMAALGLATLLKWTRRKVWLQAALVVALLPVFFRPGDFQFVAGDLLRKVDVQQRRAFFGGYLSRKIETWEAMVSDYHRLRGPYGEAIDWLKATSRKEDTVAFVYSGLRYFEHYNNPWYPALDSGRFIVNTYWQFFSSDNHEEMLGDFQSFLLYEGNYYSRRLRDGDEGILAAEIGELKKSYSEMVDVRVLVLEVPPGYRDTDSRLCFRNRIFAAYCFKGSKAAEPGRP